MSEVYQIQRRSFSPRQTWFLGSPDGSCSGGWHFIWTAFLVPTFLVAACLEADPGAGRNLVLSAKDVASQVLPYMCEPEAAFTKILRWFTCT